MDEELRFYDQFHQFYGTCPAFLTVLLNCMAQISKSMENAPLISKIIGSNMVILFGARQCSDSVRWLKSHELMVEPLGLVVISWVCVFDF